jgi:hypothetical protein
MNAAEKHLLEFNESMCFFDVASAQVPYDVRSGGGFFNMIS